MTVAIPFVELQIVLARASAIGYTELVGNSLRGYGLDSIELEDTDGTLSELLACSNRNIGEIKEILNAKGFICNDFYPVRTWSETPTADPSYEIALFPHDDIPDSVIAAPAECFAHRSNGDVVKVTQTFLLQHLRHGVPVDLAPPIQSWGM